MATLQRQREPEQPSASTSSTTFASGAVPKPFPEVERSQSRGRPGAASGANGRINSNGEQNDSRSPGGARRSLSRVVDSVKRAMSSTRSPSESGSLERGRSGSVGNTPEEPRGRSPFTAAFSPRSVSQSRTREGAIPEDGVVNYPLSKQQTRSSSRGRSLNPAGGKVFSTGRGGAGNMLGVQEDEDVGDFNGEEDPDVVNAVRTDRSRSRERQGLPEVATSGRGGRGNIRSTSRTRDLELGRVPTVMEEQERADAEDEELREIELIRKKEREGPDRWVSSGRGGAGNFFSPRRENTS